MVVYIEADFVRRQPDQDVAGRYGALALQLGLHLPAGHDQVDDADAAKIEDVHHRRRKYIAPGAVGEFNVLGADADAEPSPRAIDAPIVTVPGRADLVVRMNLSSKALNLPFASGDGGQEALSR
jgi:hypothetical protein